MSEKRIVVELQQIKSKVKRLNSKLESYLCAPKTQNLFEKKRDLKTKLISVESNTDVLISTLKVNAITDKNYITDVELQFEKFNELRKEIEAYIKMAK